MTNLVSRMSLERAIDRYIELLRSDIFLSYEKEFAQRIVSALSNGYRQGLMEPPLVQIIENVVNSVEGLIARDPRNNFELTAKSVFVHGSKSQVEFDFYGQRIQRELCDIVFIVSVVLNGRKCFEKVTLNQFKKDKMRHTSAYWDLENREQLYLLSRFPSFRGVGGSVVTPKKHCLANHSGCLGSYGLLYYPGDFAFTSASRLSSFIGDRETLPMTELYGLGDNRASHVFCCTPTFMYPRWHILGNSHFCHNVFSFVNEYLRMNIGEPTFMKIGLDSPQAKDLVHEIMNVLRSKARKTGIQRMLDFVSSFGKFPYDNERRLDENSGFDFDDGGIGMILATINLGE